MIQQKIDISALMRLKACRNRLTKQQFKTLRGQIFAGDHLGAMKGLQNLLTKVSTKQEENKNGKLDFQ